ncbi:zinc finger and BTB domain-containing protein 1-like isoform X1 [Anguilla rostrata]|uniref:zinc finger and BTB domain-containing protein 1-like isoform X1 n=2 Tax=Anguilla rostrata TaxID=7938 RepID=UPI0030D1318C
MPFRSTWCARKSVIRCHVPFHCHGSSMEADMPGRRQVMTRPNHSEHVLQQLNNQREWGFLCDCSVAVGDVDFRAHKAVLAACSSYFRMMFIKDQRARLDLSNMPVSAECFDLILQLMYLGRTLTEPGDFEELKVAMAYLQMYYIPDSPEDLKGSQSANANLPPPPSSSSSTSCSSSSSSSPSLGPAEAKMMFGVRLYEQPRRGSAEGERLVQRTLAPTPVLLGPAPVSQGVARPPAEEAMATPLAPRPAPAPVPVPVPAPADGATDRPCDLRKRPPGRRAPARERPRFGRTFTCDDCGFVFSCEKLLVEHGLTCTNRKAFQSPEARARAHGAPAWAEGSAFEGPEGDDWRERGPDPLAETPIRSVGTGTDSGPARNGGVAVKVELEEISTMDGVTAVRVGEVGEDGGPSSPRYMDEKHRCPFGRGDEEPGAEDGGPFEGPAPVKREEPGSECEPCELCGAPLEEEDRSAHYISSHLPHICACGRCGRVFVRGRQLQEHAERCGETGDAAVAAAAGSPAEADGRGWPWGSREEVEEEEEEEEGLPDRGGASSVRCPHCGLPQESEEAAVEHAARCPEQGAAAARRAARAFRHRPGAGSHRKGLYQRGGPPEPRYSRRLLRDRQLRPRGRDASRYCSPAASAPGTPPSGVTTCAT